jgi:hypothetical protein
MSSARGPAIIYRLHDFLGPPHRVRDCADRRWDPFSAIELSEFTGGEDIRCDQHIRFLFAYTSL